MPRSAILIGALLALLAVLLAAGQSSSEQIHRTLVTAGPGAPSSSGDGPGKAYPPSPQECWTEGLVWAPTSYPIAFVDANHGRRQRLLCAEGKLHPALLATADGAASWHVVTHPGVAGIFRFISPLDGWLLGERAFATHDGGITWTEDTELLNGRTLEIIGQELWAIQGSCVGIGPCDCRLLISTDVGHTWQLASIQPPTPQCGAELHSVGPLDIWICSGGGESPIHLLGTHDSGATWHEIPVPCSGWRTYFAAVDADHLWLVCSGLSGGRTEPKSIYTSADGGMEWHRVAETAYPNQDGARNLPMMGYIHGFAATSPTRAFLGLYGDSLLMTTDGGQTWDCAVAPQGADEEIGIQQVLFTDKAQGWAATLTAIWRTRDGGDTWERLAP